MLAVLGAVVLFCGIYPAPILNLMTSSLNHLAAILAQVPSATLLSGM
jgi:NADH:ubiquinone oxidoreductase subunit 4 (subunit M)